MQLKLLLNNIMNQKIIYIIFFFLFFIMKIQAYDNVFETYQKSESSLNYEYERIEKDEGPIRSDMYKFRELNEESDDDWWNNPVTEGSGGGDFVASAPVGEGVISLIFLSIGYLLFIGKRRIKLKNKIDYE